MRILVLGGTAFLGRAVVDAALRRGYDVATYTRGVSGAPPAVVTALHGDRAAAGDLRAAVAGQRFDAVVDTSGWSLAYARVAAEVLAGTVGQYAYVSSLNAYRDWPPGPIADETAPTWPDLPAGDEDYGPMKAASERILAVAFGADRVLLARAGLIMGPYDDSGRLTWWLRRIAAGGRVVVPDTLGQPIALVDVRDLAGWLVDGVVRGLAGPVNATGPVGMTTLGGLLQAVVRVVRAAGGTPAELVPIAEPVLQAAGVQPWVQLPFWLPAAMARTGWQVGTARAREFGLPSRPVEQTVRDTWQWLWPLPDLPVKTDQPRPGLPSDVEAGLLAAVG